MLEGPRDYELSLIGYLIQQPGLLISHGERLREFHFEYPIAQTLFALVAGAVRRFGRAPTEPEAEKMLRTISATGDWGSNKLALAIADMRHAWTVDVSDASGELLHEFVIRREAHAIARDLTTLEPNELLRRSREFRDRLEGLHEDQRDLDDLGISLFSTEGIIQATSMVVDLYDKDPIPSGWPSLDTMFLGGFRPGEVSVVMGTTGRGKSLALINFAANIVRTGRRIIYYALDNTMAEMAERIFACVCRIPIRKLEGDALPEYQREVLTGIGGKPNELFHIKVWPPNRKRPYEMKTHMERLQERLYKLDKAAGLPDEQCGHIDAIIPDYASQFCPERRREAYRMEVGDIFLELVALSRELDKTIITAHQGNRQALSLDGIGLEHVGESLAALQPVANVIGLGQSRAEKRLNQMRAQLLKARRAEAEGWEIHLCINKRLQLMEENLEKEPTLIEGYHNLDEAQQENERQEESSPRPRRRTGTAAPDNGDVSSLVGLFGSPDPEPSLPGLNHEG